MSRPPAEGRPILLRGGRLVTMDPRLRELTGDILIAGDRIAEVAPNIAASDCTVVDAADFIVLPGFVDPHRHLWQTVLRHTALDWDLPRMFVEMFRKFGPNFRPEDVYANTLFGRLTALDAGVTTLLDWAHIQNTPDCADEAVRALRESGGRSIFGHGQPGNDPVPWMKDSKLPHLADIRRVREKLLPSDDSLVTLAMAARGPEFCTMDVVAHDVKLARELGLRITMHIGMGEAGARNRAIAKMHERRLLGPDLTCLHCCTSGDDELKMLADTGTTASVSSLMAMLAGGFGLPATGRLLAQGIRPSLSADSEMCACGDMFTEMRTALAMERTVHHNAVPDGPPRSALTARDVLEFATVEGARTLGLDSQIGSLTPGKYADLILVRRHDLNLAPAIDPLGALVIGGHAGNVDGVLVAGRPVKWNGAMLGGAVPRARRALEHSVEFLYAAAAKMEVARA